MLRTKKGTFRMLNAYYDNRNYLKKNGKSTIRVMTVHTRNHSKDANLFCQIWFDGIADPVISEVYEYRPVWYEKFRRNSTDTLSIFLSCLNPLVDQGLIPLSVSIVESPCGVPSNKFDVIYKLPEDGKKKTVAVCAKLLDFRYDSTMQLIEWIEILIILGANKIIINIIRVHPNVMSVLEFYEKNGKVELILMTAPNAPVILFYTQMIAINDCFYKNMYKFDYITSLDIDEIIIPSRIKDKTWQDLLKRVVPKGRRINRNGFNTYESRMVLYNLDNNHQGEIQSEVPSFLMFLQHIYRSSKFSGERVGSKSFMRTDNVIVIHMHRAMQCANGCTIFQINPIDSRVQHYREGCGGGFKPELCDELRNDTVRDATLWRYKDEIMKNVNETLEMTKNLLT